MTAKMKELAGEYKDRQRTATANEETSNTLGGEIWYN